MPPKPLLVAPPPPLPLKPFTCRMTQRSLIRMMGKDAHELLQGLFTNDVTLLRPGGSMWGCFLYFQGRVMCDAYVYQANQVYQGQASLLLDVHHDVKEKLLDHLVEMKMRKKVKIEDVSDALSVAACLERGEGGAGNAAAGPTGGGGSQADPAPSGATLSDSLAETFTDPRSSALFPSPQVPSATGEGPLWTLRKRIVPVAWAPPSQPAFGATRPVPVEEAAGTTSDMGEVGADAKAVGDAFREAPYQTLLMAHGVAEGPQLFRDGKSLPFELNTDFLGGVHFNKGCYVGQELTHRTHVMLVTRKRTVPLYFPVVDGADGGSRVRSDTFVGQGLYINEGKEKVGEVTAACGPFGLGLLRLRYVDKETRTIPDLSLKDGQPVRMHFPAWWPPKQIKKILKHN